MSNNELNIGENNNKDALIKFYKDLKKFSSLNLHISIFLFIVGILNIVGTTMMNYDANRDLSYISLEIILLILITILMKLISVYLNYGINELNPNPNFLLYLNIFCFESLFLIASKIIIISSYFGMNLVNDYMIIFVFSIKRLLDNYYINDYDINISSVYRVKLISFFINYLLIFGFNGFKDYYANEFKIFIILNLLSFVEYYFYIKAIIFNEEKIEKLRKEKSKSEKAKIKYFDIINHLNQGLLIFNISKGITFINKFILKIIKRNDDYQLNQSSTDIIKFKDEQIDNDKHDQQLIQERINKLISKIKSINPKLQNKVSEYIENSRDNNFNLKTFLQIVEENKTIFTSEENFLYIGIVYWKNRNQKFILHDIDPLNYELELRIRRVVTNDEITYQLLLTDITKAIEFEKKDVINKYKANFLEKIAHEIRNPLCAILELSEEIDVRSNELFDSTDKQSEELKCLTKFIRNISKLMNYIIQDFSITSTIDDWCITCNKEKEYCNACLMLSKCKTCKKCLYCNDLRNQQFKYADKIKECVSVFETKNEIDQKDPEIIYDCSNLKDETHIPEILNNLDYFKSIIFNLLYYINNKDKRKNHIFFKSKFCKINDKICYVLK